MPLGEVSPCFALGRLSSSAAFVQTKPPSRAGSDSIGLPDSTRSACRTLRNQGDNPSLARCEFIVLQVLQVQSDPGIRSASSRSKRQQRRASVGSSCTLTFLYSHLLQPRENSALQSVTSRGAVFPSV